MSAVEEWLFPAGTFEVPAEAFVGVHHGAGVTTWAALLGGADHGLLVPGEGLVTAVCRATPAGVNGAKLLVKEHGVARFRAFLVVADAPGRLLPAAEREIKVLASTVPVVEVPWVIKLRGVEDPRAVAGEISKPVSRVRDQLATAQVRVPRGFGEIEKGKRK